MEEDQKSEPSPTHVSLDDALKALGRLGTLTFQQRQMAKDGDVITLLEQAVAARQSNRWLTLLIAVGLGSYSVFRLFSDLSSWVSAGIAVVVTLELARQKRVDKDVTKIVRQYAADHPAVDETDESLLTSELRSRHLLSYQQIQRIKAGDVTEVAEEIIQKARFSSRLQLAVIAFLLLTQVLIAVTDPTNTANPFAFKQLLLRFGHFVVIAAGFAQLQWITHNQIRRLQQLLHDHSPDRSAESPGTESQTETDSPYRSPQFR